MPCIAAQEEVCLLKEGGAVAAEAMDADEATGEAAVPAGSAQHAPAQQRQRQRQQVVEEDGSEDEEEREASGGSPPRDDEY